jgi:hypothetical protein
MKRPIWTSVGAALLVLVAGGGYWYLSSQPDSPIAPTSVDTVADAPTNPETLAPTAAEPDASEPVASTPIVRTQGRGRIHGTIRMHDGTSVPRDVVVELVQYAETEGVPDPETEPVATTPIADDDTFAFEDLPMGSYILFAENPDLTQNSSATLTADRPEMQRTLTLYPGGAITGRVENEAGDPIPDARVYVAAYDIAGSRTNANRVRALGSQTESDEPAHLRSATYAARAAATKVTNSP